MLPEQKLDALLARHHAVESELASQLTPETYVKLSREFAELGPSSRRSRPIASVVAEIADLEAMLADPATDAEMRAHGGSREAALEAQARGARAGDPARAPPKDAMDERNVILEIRAGTGGDEASLFAGDLFRMYERYAAKQGWKVEVISASEGTMGGYKEIIAEIRGRGAFAKLKFESGVHRVQRVPDTEGVRAASTPRPRPSRCCRRPRRSTSTSTRPTSRSTPCARAAPAASTSTRPNRRSASPTSRPASW